MVIFSAYDIWRKLTSNKLVWIIWVCKFLNFMSMTLRNVMWFKAIQDQSYQNLVHDIMKYKNLILERKKVFHVVVYFESKLKPLSPWVLFLAIQCEECATYNPCISACPKKTCKNYLTYDQITKDSGCKEESCVEGCDVKPCSTGMVYDKDSSPMKCIPEPFCNTPACMVNGRQYRLYEQIKDPDVCRQDCEVW